MSAFGVQERTSLGEGEFASRAFGCGFVPLTWHFVQKEQSLTPPALDPIGYLTGAADKKLSFGGQRSIQLSYGRA